MPPEKGDQKCATAPHPFYFSDTSQRAVMVEFPRELDTTTKDEMCADMMKKDSMMKSDNMASAPMKK